MTGYDTQAIISRNRHAGTLHRELYTMTAASEEPPECQRRLISIPGATLSSVRTHRAAPALDVWGGQGTITATYYATDISTATVTVAPYFAHLSGTEYLDPGNIAISNFGRGFRNLSWANEIIALTGDIHLEAQAKSALFSDGARDLAIRYQASSYLQQALRLAQKSFSGLDGIAVTAETDPETDEEWVAVSVKVTGNIKDVLDMYDTYTRQFVESVPWPARDKIRLVYDLI